MTPDVSQPAVQKRLYHPREAWLLAAPVLVGLVILTYGPTLVSLALGFTEWDLLGPIRWQGLANYQALVQDPTLLRTLLNTLVFVGATTFLEVVIGLSLALGIDTAMRATALGRRVASATRLSLLIPFLVPLASMGLVWQWLLAPGDTGWINAVLTQARLVNGPAAWLYEPFTAMAWVVIVQVWRQLGYTVLLLWAGLSQLPAEVSEAAELDGSRGFSKLWHVTLPMLSPTLFFVMTVSMMSGFQAFDAIYLLTKGGPENATQVLVYGIFEKAFAAFNIGQASVLAVVLFGCVMALTLLQWQVRRRWVLYEAE